MASDIIIPYGVGINLVAGIIAGKKIEKISGSNFHEVIINYLNARKSTCFYLGSFDDTLGKIRE